MGDGDRIPGKSEAKRSDVPNRKESQTKPRATFSKMEDENHQHLGVSSDLWRCPMIYMHMNSWILTHTKTHTLYTNTER